jgi:hypothetical protein
LGADFRCARFEWRAPSRRALLPAVFLCAALFLPWLSALAAQQFEIRAAYVERNNGVYTLNAKLDFRLPDGAQQAVQDGARMTLDLEIVVRRARSLWFDETIAVLEQHYELIYHALSERYLVRNVNSGEQTSFPTLSAAIEYLSQIHGLPLLDETFILPRERYEISLRANVDVRTLPKALRTVLFWVDDWRQSTDWYTWPLKL